MVHAADLKLAEETPSVRTLSITSTAGSSSSTEGQTLAKQCSISPLALSSPPGKTNFRWADDSGDEGDESSSLAPECSGLELTPWPRHVGASDIEVLLPRRPPNRDSVEPSPEMMAAVYAKIPLDEIGQLTSVGSVDHAGGNCLPCLYWFQLHCPRGVHCTYCHIVHPGQKKKRIRPSKKSRINAQPERGGKKASKGDGDDGNMGGGDEDRILLDLLDSVSAADEAQSTRSATSSAERDSAPSLPKGGDADSIDESAVWELSDGEWAEVGECVRTPLTTASQMWSPSYDNMYMWVLNDGEWLAVPIA